MGSMEHGTKLILASYGDTSYIADLVSPNRQLSVVA